MLFLILLVFRHPFSNLVLELQTFCTSNDIQNLGCLCAKHTTEQNTVKSGIRSSCQMDVAKAKCLHQKPKSGAKMFEP